MKYFKLIAVISLTVKMILSPAEACGKGNVIAETGKNQYELNASYKPIHKTAFSSDEIVLLEEKIPLLLPGKSGKVDKNLYCDLKVKLLPSGNSTEMDNLFIELEVNANNYFYAGENIFPIITSFDLNIISSKPDFAPFDPLYLIKSWDHRLNAQSTLGDWEILNCTPRSSAEIVASSVLSVGLQLTPIIGQVISFGGLIEETINTLNMDETNYLELWDAAYWNDSYPISRLQFCQDGFGAKAYQLYIPFKCDMKDLDLSLLIQEIVVSGYHNEPRYAKTDKFELTRSMKTGVLSKAPMNMDDYSAKVSQSTGMNAELFNPEISFEGNDLVIDMNMSERPENYYFSILPTIIAEKGSMQITGLPSYYDANGNILSYANLKKEESFKLALNWALFAGSVIFPSNKISKGTSLVSMTDKTAKFATKKGGVDLLNAAWEFENNFNRFLFPVPVKRDGIVSKIRIPIEKYDDSPIYLELKGNSAGINVNTGNRITGSVSKYDDFNVLYQFKLRPTSHQSRKGQVKVGLILDSSGSMVDSDPNDVRKAAAEAIIDFLKDDDHVFIVDFDGNATFLNDGQTQVGTSANLKSYIQQIDSEGGTDIGIGLDRMRDALTSSGLGFESTGVVLLTDGQGSYDNQAEWFEQQGIPVYTVSYKEFADASLMNNIASLTDGIYLTANNEDDVIQAFSQFYYGVSGNSTIYREVITTAGPYHSKPIYIDPTVTEMIVYLNNLDINPSLVAINMPDGDIIKLSETPDVVKGDDYVFARVPVKIPGNHTIDVNPTFSLNQAVDDPFQVSQGGPSEPIMNYTVSNSYVLEVSADTKLDVDIAVEENKGIYEVNFSGDVNEVNLENATVSMNVTTPSGRSKKYVSTSKKGSISFIPIEGEGNYQINATFNSSDQSGNPIQRYFLRSVVVGEFTPSYIGMVDFVSGSEIQTAQGFDTQNQIGINVKVYKKGSDLTNPIASGRVTNVKETSCSIYLNVMYENVEEGDIVFLEVSQWQADF